MAKTDSDVQKGFLLRQISDYEVHAKLDKDQVEELVKQAHAFVKFLKQFLSKRST